MADDTTDTDISPPEVSDGLGDAQPDDQLASDAITDDATPDEGEGVQQAEELPLTPEQIVQQTMNQEFQRWATYQGRRDKELLGTFEQLVNQRIAGLRQPASTPSDPATILDNPDAWVTQRIQQIAPQVLHNEINRVTAAEQNYTAALIQHAGQMMDGDPLFADKSLGNEVIAEIQKGFGSVNKNLPPNINAQLLISNAVTNIYRRNAGQKTNALAGNKGVKVGVGGVKAGTPSKSSKRIIEKLDPDAARLAKMWNYKEEDLQRAFKGFKGIGDANI